MLARVKIPQSIITGIALFACFGRSVIAQDPPANEDPRLESVAIDAPAEVVRLLILHGVSSEDDIIREWALTELHSMDVSEDELSLILDKLGWLGSQPVLPAHSKIDQLAFAKVRAKLLEGSAVRATFDKVFAILFERSAPPTLFWVVQGLNSDDRLIQLNAADYLEALFLPVMKTTHEKHGSSLFLPIMKTIDEELGSCLGEMVETDTPRALLGAIRTTMRHGLQENAHDVWKKWMGSTSHARQARIIQAASRFAESRGGVAAALRTLTLAPKGFHPHPSVVRRRMQNKARELMKAALNSGGQKAESAYREAISLFSESDDLIGLTVALGNLANLYRISKRYREAERLYFRKLGIEEAKGDRTRAVSTLRSIGDLYKAEGLNSESERYYRQSLKFSETAR